MNRSHNARKRVWALFIFFNEISVGVAANQSCVSDYDCPANELCYSRTGWFINGNYSTQANDTMAGCYCNTFYGFTGSICTEPSISTKITIAWNFFSFILGILTVIALCSAMIRLKQQNKLVSSLHLLSTIILALIGTIMAALWALMVALSATIRDGPLSDTHVLYKGRFNGPSRAFGPLAVGFSALALLHVSLTWLQIALSSGGLTPNQHSRLLASRKYIYVFEAFSVFVGLTGAIYEKRTERSIMGFLLVPLILLILASYAAGAFYLHQLFRLAAKVHSEFRSSSTAPIPAGNAVSPLDGRDNSGSSAYYNSLKFAKIKGAHVLSPDIQMDSQNNGDRSESYTIAYTSSIGRKMSEAPFVGSGKLKTISLSSDKIKIDNSQVFHAAVNQSGPSYMVVNNQQLYLLAMLKIRKTVRLVMICLLLFLTSTVGISSIDQVSRFGWKENASPVAIFPTIKVFHHLQMTSIVLSQLCIAFYTLPSRLA